MKERAAAELTTEDAIILTVQLQAWQSCQAWARVEQPDLLQPPVLQDRQCRHQAGRYPLTPALLGRRGLWRIMLTSAADLPSVSPDTRLAVHRAYQCGPAGNLTMRNIDEIVQVAVFGEVLY